MPPATRQALAALLRELSRDARERAERSRRQNKAPVAVYWKAVSVYAGHLYRVVRPTKAELGTPMTIPRSHVVTAAPAAGEET